uniref:serine/threonine-protein kinase n=1 Tax=Cumulibacter manganitolerans TaxID=1884992 RepID=UPI0012978F41
MTASDRAGLWLPTARRDDDYVGPYRIVREAGSGGMGVVYLAVDADERPVALKVLREHIADDPQARARLRRELELMRRVRDRNIADVIDADLEAARPYIVTEFVDGPQLDDYVADVGPLGREGLVTLGRGLISALRAIHAVGVVHRDLKPGNVLLEGYRPVVIDFGIARLADDVRLTMTGLFIGTPGYVAPEVVYGDQATPATDWWAWAAVLGYAATGTAPSGRGPIEVVLDRIRRGELRLDGVDGDLRPLLEDCLAVRPADRPSAAQIRDRFQRYAGGGSTATARRPPAPRGAVPSRPAPVPLSAPAPPPG